jgi:K+-transporting ATPase ATPase A chain
MRVFPWNGALPQAHPWLELALFFFCLIGLTPLLGHLLARILRGDKLPVLSWLGPVEKGLYRLGGIDPNHEMDWREYAFCLLAFNGLGLLVLLALQIFQNRLPLNPQALPAVPALLALNTAVSFVTNTNWQAYSGESTLSYLVQMLGLTVQNFVSAATGLAVIAPLARGLVRKETNALGNFWADLVRSTLYVLLPCALLLAPALVSQGVIQNLDHYVDAKTVEGAVQSLPMGPAASQVAIKQLGTNGGGFFGVNSAHPFENPTPLSNFLEVLSILLLASACAYAFGLLVKSRRHGVALLSAMFIVFTVCLAGALWAELRPDPALAGLPFLEGKETRFGIVPSVLWEQATTVASNGSVNAMHDSFSPLAGGLGIFNMMMGEVIFGGVGSGLYTIVLHVVLTVFIAGLMVGRTPEYLGKKIESRDIVYAVIGVLLPGVAVLAFSALSAVLPAGVAGLANAGPHGLSEILYAFASTANNNGSAFSGLNVNTPYYNLLTAAAMLIGRYGVILPVLALAGNLAAKKYVPPSAGTFPTEGLLFVILLIGVIVIVGALTFFPALSLGPIMEHFLMTAGRVF